MDDNISNEFTSTASQRITTVGTEVALGLNSMQPHYYALVVGLGCLALFLVLLMIGFFAHWRRRVYAGGPGHKLEKLGRSLQHPPSTMPLIKQQHQQQHSQQLSSNSKLQLPTEEGDQFMMRIGGDAYRTMVNGTYDGQQKQLQQMTMGPMFMDARGFLHRMPPEFNTTNPMMMNQCIGSPMPQHRSSEVSSTSITWIHKL